MECKCNNSIKYIILSYLQKNNNFYEINELINCINNIINQEENKELYDIICNLDNIDNNFIKGYIKNLINEMLNTDNNILKRTLDINDKNKYYFMNINKNNINNIKNNNKNNDKENKFQKPTEEKNINLFDSEFPNNNIFQKSSDLINTDSEFEKKNKIKDLIILKKKLENIKKEKNNKKVEHLHKYNEIKDTAQNILGAIANNKNIPIKELYKEKDINDNDDEEFV